MKKKEIVLLLSLALVNFTHIIDFMIMMPMGAMLMEDLKIAPSQVSFLISVYTMSAGVMSFLAFFFIDKFDRKKVLIFGYFGSMLGTLASALSPNYEILLLTRILTGIFGGLFSAQVYAIVADIIPYERRGRAMGILSMAFSAASIIGVPFSLVLANKYSWHAPFYAVSLMGFLITLLIFKTVPPVKEHLANRQYVAPLSMLPKLLSNKVQIRGLTLMFSLMFSHFMIIPFLAPYMELNVGFERKQITYIYLFGGLLTFVTYQMIGRLTDKVGKFKTLRFFLIGSAIPVLAIVHMPQVPVYYALIATSLFFVVAGGRMVPAQAITASIVEPQERGGFMSLNSSLQNLATALASLVAGLIVSKAENGQLLYYHYTGYLGVILSLACIFIANKLHQLKPEIK